VGPVVFGKHIGGLTAGGVGQTLVVGEGFEALGHPFFVGGAHDLVNRDRGSKAEDMEVSTI